MILRHHRHHLFHHHHSLTKTTKPTTIITPKQASNLFQSFHHHSTFPLLSRFSRHSPPLSLNKQHADEQHHHDHHPASLDPTSHTHHHHHHHHDNDEDVVPPPPIVTTTTLPTSTSTTSTTTPLPSTTTTSFNQRGATTATSTNKLKNFFYVNQSSSPSSSLPPPISSSRSLPTLSPISSKFTLPPSSTSSTSSSSSSSSSSVPSTALYQSWKMIKFEMDGKVRVVDVPRSFLYSHFGLQGRDIRTVVSNVNYPTILARKRCIVLDIRSTSAIITENAMYLIKNDSFDPSIIPFIQQEIKYHRTASKINKETFSSSNEHTENNGEKNNGDMDHDHDHDHDDQYPPYHHTTSVMNQSSSTGSSSSSQNHHHHQHSSSHSYYTQQYGYYEHSHSLPFEFQMLECILHKTCREVEAEYESFQAQVKRTLHDPDLVSSEDLLFEILQHKRYMNKFTTFVRELYEAIDGLLESDEDMASMYLTEALVWHRPRSVDKHEEIEMLLETYLTQLEDVLNRIEELKSDINSTQDFLEICLDAVRNRMIEYDLKMTIAGFAITLGTLVAGLFGMNLLNHFEQSPVGFYLVSGAIAAASISAFAIVMIRLKRRGVFTSAQYFNQKSKRLQEASSSASSSSTGFTAGTGTF